MLISTRITNPNTYQSRDSILSHYDVTTYKLLTICLYFICSDISVVEINIAWDDAYQILFDLGERGGKRMVDTNLTSLATYIDRKSVV